MGMFQVYDPGVIRERNERRQLSQRRELRQVQEFQAQQEHRTIQEFERLIAQTQGEVDPEKIGGNAFYRLPGWQQERIREMRKAATLMRKRKEGQAQLGASAQLAAVTDPSPQQMGQAGPPTPAQAAVQANRQQAEALGQGQQLTTLRELEQRRAVGGLPEQLGEVALADITSRREEGRLARTGSMVPTYDTRQDPPKFIGMRDLDDPETRRELKQNPYLLPTPTMAQGTLSDLSPISKRGREAAASEVSAIAGRLVDLSSLKKEMQRVGEGSVGYKGFITTYVAGPVAQFNEALGDRIANVVSGASKEEVAEIEIQAKSMVSQLISQLAAERTGRVTQFELQRTERVSRLSSPSASFTQVLASLNELISLSVLTQHRRAFDAGLPYDNVRSPKDREKIAIRLERLGQPANHILRVLEDLAMLQDELDRTGIQSPGGERR